MTPLGINLLAYSTVP